MYDVTYNIFGIEIYNLPNTLVEFWVWDKGIDISPPIFYNAGEKLIGWNHFDITLDADGNSIAYLNGEPIVEYTLEAPFESKYFYFFTPSSGPALDNVVVRNQVIDIQPPE